MYFFTPIPWDTKEETPFIQSRCVGWHMPHAALGLLTRPVLPDVVNGSSLTFTAEELRLLLPYPRAVVSVCGEGQMWKHLVLLQCGKDLFFAGPARLQPMAQNELISDAAVFLPISLRGRCSDVHWAHHCFTDLVKNLLANLFSYSKCLDALHLLGMAVWALQPLAGSLCMLEALLAVVTWWGGHSR